MAGKLNKILLKGADLKVKKIDFESPEIKASLKEVHAQQEEAFLRKQIDPDKLKLIIKL